MVTPTKMPLFILLALFCRISAVFSDGMLQPQESESRQIQEMNGMWEFRADMSVDRSEGMLKQWWTKRLRQTGPVMPMPVPSSYNDITTDAKLRDFVGWVWYDRSFFVSNDWKNKRTVLRVDSAHYYTMVWVNGNLLMEHNGGHLPFESDKINELLNFGSENYVTIAVNNTLGPHTLPPGSLSFHYNDPRYPPHYFTLTGQFDFFNYAGIHRRVRLYATPLAYVDDITIVTSFSGSTGTVSYYVTVEGPAQSVKCEIVDKEGTTVASSSTASGTMKITNVNLWWPYTMNLQNPAYMYHMKVTVTSNDGTQDVYRQHFGVRTVKFTNKQILINDKPFYCQGVNKHEDSDIRGKGLDFPLIARDFNMLKWLGASCFRTSHYPYAEEIMDQADRQGIMVIDEAPAVGLKTVTNFGNVTLDHHKDVMRELITRDKNRPGVMMWSVANEPDSSRKEAEYYFKTILGYTRSLDPTRPATFVANSEYNSDHAMQFADIICLNRYYGWYSDTGHPEVIPYQLRYELDHNYAKFNKAMIISEYGADTVAGLHRIPQFIFTEDYQVEFIRQYHKTFDEYRPKFLVGEMIWNYADFMTDQSVNRVVGNKKGILTRQRQPKAAAYVIRERYWSLTNQTSPFTTISDGLI